MAQAGSVEALLRLNTSNFDSGITKSLEKIESFVNAMKKLGNSSISFTKGFQTLQHELANLDTAISRITSSSEKFKNFNTAATGVEKLVNAVIRFNREGGVTVTTFTELGNGVRAFMNSLGGIDVTLTNVVNAERQFVNENNQVASSSSNAAQGVNQLEKEMRSVQSAASMGNSSMGNFNNTAKNTASSANSAASSTKNLSQGMSSGVSNTNKMNTASRGLNNTLNTLRMTVGMVASMFLFNFAHNMMISVKNTVAAKSEMMSYLHTMGMTQGQINSFNYALDQTAERFQRINKYNIGETVANIGLEFDLSAQEMEKAMSVTSMITSEYLRAGRNADEAALAVKDIMQGQFQRLSRETGVKGEQLKEAGWSGDENDVLGLMDALEKVAKARHWDVFAEKANSLNDVVLITQNRLSEWATDVSEGVVPIITNAFNTLVSVVDNVTGFFQGVASSLNLPDWSGTALLIGGVTAALGALLIATITTRTHMGLLQIAHQGLTQSILATIFGIKSEEMANMKATTVIKAKILGVKSETMANQGLINILKAKALGLDVETMAQEGVTVAIEKKLMAQRLEELQAQKNTAGNFSLLSSYISLKTGIELSDMAGLKWYQRLALLNKQIDVSKAKTMGLGQSLKSFISSINKASLATKLFTGSLVALAGIAIAGYIASTMSSTRAMKEFTDMVENGDEKIRKMKNTFGENSQEAKNMTEAVEKARSAMGKFEERKYNAQGRMGSTIYNYLDGMVNKDKLRELSDASLRDSAYGVSQLAKLGDEVEQTYRGAANTVGMLKDKVNDLRGEQGLAKFAEDIERNADDIATAQEKLRLSTSPTERLQYWLDLQIGQMGHWWNEFTVNFESHDWGAAWDNVWKGFMRGFSQIPIASDIWNTIFNSINLKDHIVKGDLGGSLKKMGQDFMNWVFQGMLEQGKDPSNTGHWFSEAIHNLFGPIDDFIKDPLGSIGLKNINLGQMLSDWWNGMGGNGNGMQMVNMPELLNKLFNFGDSVDWVGEWFNNSIIAPIQNWMSTLDLSTLATPMGMFSALLDLIFGQGTSEQMNAFLQTTIIQPLMNLPIAIQGYLTTAVGNFVNFASQLWSQGTTAGMNFLNSVTTYISQVPGRVGSYITQTASNIMSGASQWVSNAQSKASETVNAVITQVSQLPGKVYQEFINIANRIRESISEAVSAATSFGSDVVNAVLNALHIHSPGIIQEKIATEFANIPGRIAENTAQAQTEAGNFGSAIVDGMGNQISNIQATAQMMSQSMSQMQPITDGSFVGEYQSDATQIYGINAMMTTDTATAFNTMGSTVNTTIDGISANLTTSYLNMNTSQTTALTTMQNQNKTAYTNLQNQTTTSLNNMRSTTQNVTLQMVNAWNHMKDNIIYSADQLKTQSTSHFNQLSDNIGGFYRRLQNPSSWGAGDTYRLSTPHYSPHRGLRGANEVRRAFGVPTSGRRIHGAGGPSDVPERMTLRKLKSLVGGSPVFRGLDLDQEVNVAEFLAMNGLALGWGDWHPSHFDTIKNTSGEWDMKGPQIMHRIDTGTAFKVKEFYNSTPQISFSSFQRMAEALFSAIPYEYYFDSDAHGNWVNALYAGSCNCVDGANALIALASTCGFSGHTQGGTWNGIPHVYAVINGKKMDTTGWQQRRDWNGVAAGSPSGFKGFGENKTVNVNIDMTNSTFNGEEDFENKMRDVAKKVMSEEVNTSITIGI